MKTTMTRAGIDMSAIAYDRRRVRQVLKAMQAWFGKAERAHEQRRAYEAIDPQMMHDIGMTPDTATGIPSWQADLPFFMQSGFGRR